MRIAHLISEYLPGLGGAEVHVHNITLGLIKKKDHVVVITTTKGNSSRNYGYPVIRIAEWYKRSLFRFAIIGKYLLWYKLSRLQEKFRFDIWQVTVGYPLGVYAVAFLKSRNIPCVLRCCGDDIQTNEEISYGCRRSSFVDKLVRENYPKYDGLVALTESIRGEYLKLEIPNEKIHIIPNGVNLERFKGKGERNIIRNKHSLKNKVVLLTVGRNHPKKGHHLIPSILQQIYKSRNDVVWIVIGRECSKIPCHNLSRELRKNLILLDEIDNKQYDSFQEFPPSELIDYYKGADLFVFLSYMESFGMVLVEANAAGLPVVASNSPGCRDVVKNGINGLLVETGNSRVFAEKILDLLSNKNLYNQICKKILKDVKEYDWDVIVGKYRKLYKSVIQRKIEEGNGKSRTVSISVRE